VRRPLVMLVNDTLHVVGRADLASVLVATLGIKTVYDVLIWKSSRCCRQEISEILTLHQYPLRKLTFNGRQDLSFSSRLRSFHEYSGQSDLLSHPNALYYLS